jgi:hypothetical protein
MIIKSVFANARTYRLDQQMKLSKTCVRRTTEKNTLHNQRLFWMRWKIRIHQQCQFFKR